MATEKSTSGLLKKSPWRKLRLHGGYLTEMILRDTSDEALDVYFKRLAAMTASERVRVGVALWEAGNSLQRAAIRHENPDIDEDEITFRVAVRRFGVDLARQAYRRT